jgi:amidase
MESIKNERQFVHYPEVLEGPSVPYQNETQSIPVFRGTPLAIGAAVYVDLDPEHKLQPPSISLN